MNRKLRRQHRLESLLRQAHRRLIRLTDLVSARRPRRPSRRRDERRQRRTRQRSWELVMATNELWRLLNRHNWQIAACEKDLTDPTRTAQRQTILVSVISSDFPLLWSTPHGELPKNKRRGPIYRSPNFTLSVRGLDFLFFFNNKFLNILSVIIVRPQEPYKKFKIFPRITLAILAGKPAAGVPALIQ